MKRHLVAGVVILFAFSLIFSVDDLSAKPAAPHNLERILDEVDELEDMFEAGQWRKAIRALKDISASVNAMLPELQKTIRGDISAAFTSRIANLERALVKRDIVESQRHFIDLLDLFFVTMDNYEYRVPPVLSIIDKYIGEADEALKKRDFRRVHIEMDEISDFFYRVEPLLQEKGVKYKDIEEFKSVLREVRAAAEAKKATDVKPAMQALKQRFAQFLSLF